jgi:hypothetical protein
VSRKAKSKATKKQPRKKAGSQSEGIPLEQRQLVAGFRRDGSAMLSVPESDAKNLSDLSEDEQASLTAERIRAQKKYSIELVGLGKLDKERAIAEVQNRTPAGRVLMDIERRTVRMLIEAARAEAQGGKAR